MMFFADLTGDFLRFVQIENEQPLGCCEFEILQNQTCGDILSMILDTELQMHASKMLNLYVGLCSAEIEEIQTTCYTEVKQTTQHNKGAENPKWDVNVYSVIMDRNGKRSRRHQRRHNSADVRFRRPHKRRGHWHHYWIGPKDERKLIVKWVPEIDVNGSNEYTPIRINIVKQ